MTQRFLFIIRTPPQGGLRVRETLDMVLTTAAFDQAVSVLYMDDGIYQLRQGQQAENGQSVIGEMLEAFSLYGVENVWVERESLLSRRMTLSDLVIKTEIVDRARLSALLQRFDLVLGR